MTLNLLAVLLLITADTAAYIPPARLHLPALLAIGFEFLVAANALFAFTWLFSAKKSWCAVSLVALLLSVPAMKVTFSTGKQDIRPEHTHSLAVLSYNTHLLQNNTPVEQNDLLRYIKNSGAQVALLQEYAVYKNTKYPTFQQVKNALSDTYPYTYFDFSIHNQRQQFGLAVYSKYPLIHKTTIPIDTKGKGNGANYCDIVVGADTFRLFNNHLQSNSLEPSEIDSLLHPHARPTVSFNKHLTSKLATAYTLRTHQVQRIRQAIDESPYPVIVCGDFNDVPTSYTYRQLARGLKDAFLTTSFLRTGHTYVRSSALPWFHNATFGPGIRIDYILTDPMLRATDFRIDRVAYSDHYPVMAAFTW